MCFIVFLIQLVPKTFDTETVLVSESTLWITHSLPSISVFIPSQMVLLFQTISYLWRYSTRGPIWQVPAFIVAHLIIMRLSLEWVSYTNWMQLLFISIPSFDKHSRLFVTSTLHIYMVLVDYSVTRFLEWSFIVDSGGCCFFTPNPIVDATTDWTALFLSAESATIVCLVVGSTSDRMEMFALAIQCFIQIFLTLIETHSANECIHLEMYLHPSNGIGNTVCTEEASFPHFTRSFGFAVDSARFQTFIWCK